MFKIILTLFLVMQWSAASAAWQEVTRNRDSGLTVYVDKDTVAKADDRVSMVVLYDFSKPQNDEGVEAYSSTKFTNEYDCKTQKRRVLDFGNYAKRMGKGELTFSFNDADIWRDIDPGDPSEQLWKFACSQAEPSSH